MYRILVGIRLEYHLQVDGLGHSLGVEFESFDLQTHRDFTLPSGSVLWFLHFGFGWVHPVVDHDPWRSDPSFRSVDSGSFFVEIVDLGLL